MFIRDRGNAAQIQATDFCVGRELINSIRPTACCEQLRVRQERKKYGDAPGDVAFLVPRGKRMKIGERLPHVSSVPRTAHP